MAPTSPTPFPRDLTRRTFLGLSLAAGGAVLLTACGSSDNTGGTNSPTGSSTGSSATSSTSNEKVEISVLYFEGAGQDVVPKKVIDAFVTANPHVTVKPVIGGSRFPEILAAYKANGTALVQAGLFTAAVMAQGQALQMFEPVATQVPRAASANSAYRLFGDDGVPFNTNLVGLIYREDLVDAPTSWLDMLDPKYKGKVGLYDAPQGILLGGLWSVNQALGGNPSTLDKGFEAFAKAAKDGQFSTVYNSNQTQFDAMSRGEVALGASILATQVAWSKQGAKIGYVAPGEGQLGVPLYLAVPKGSTDAQRKAAIALVNELATAENVAAYNENTFAASVFPDVKPSAEQMSMPAFSADALAKVQQVDWADQATVQASLVERWNRDVKGNLK